MSISRRMVEFDIIQFAITRKLLWISGLWPYLKPSQRYTRVIITSISFIMAYSCQVLNFLSTPFSITSSVLYIAYMLTTISMSIIYHYLLFHKRQILRYLMQIMNDWSDIRETEQFEVLLDYAFLYRKCIFIFILSYNTYISFMFLSSLTPLLLDLTVPLNESRPYTLIIPMNWYTGQERHFLKILIFQLVISMILGLCVISSFSMSILILQHVCAMFHIIGCLLDNILNVKEKNLKAIDDEVICKRIIHIIKIHSKTIQYIDVFNKTFNVIFLVLLTCALCFIGIALISILEIFGEFKNSSRDIGSLTLPIFYIIFHLIWIFVFCHIGQYLQNISETTFYKAYDTPWYLFSKQSQRLLSFLIARSYKPVYMSIGRMFVASHELFTAFVQSSISYAIGIYSLR